MAFFKKWKTNSKHKKLCEEWALATSLRDFSEINQEIDDETEPTQYNNVKYLGNTIIEAERSEEATADAVKSVISTAKASGKKLQRVNLSISPKGIDMFDPVSGEAMLQVSIYRISYCSADAAHDQVFAFVESADDNGKSYSQTKEPTDPKDPSNMNGTLICHAFLCQKRKHAQAVTLTVAKSFETAYQLWRDANERKKYQNEKKIRSNCNTKPNQEDESMRSLLIDFNSEMAAELCSKDHRSYLQNTWVSFDDDTGKEISEVPRLHENVWEPNIICSS